MAPLNAFSPIPAQVRIFEDVFPFEAVVKNPATRLLSIVLFVAFLTPCIHYMTKLTPQTSAEQFLPDDHPFQRFFMANSQFPASQEDEVVEMQIVYGFDPSDPIELAASPRLFSPDALGTARLRPSFELSPAAQQALLDDCAHLKAATTTVRSLFDQQTATTKPSVFCWIEAFEAYRACVGQPFPVPTADVSSAVAAWLVDGGWSCPDAARPSGNDDRRDFRADLGWAPSADGGALTLTWTRLRADSLINERAFLPANELRQLFNEWEGLIGELNANTTADLGEAMQISSTGTTTSENKWLHMILQETYVQMALTGVAYGLAIALIVLVFATMNLIISVLSILTIACALCCVVGVVVMRGWQLGSAESLSMMILTGFAVDYVVHLAHAYAPNAAARGLPQPVAAAPPRHGPRVAAPLVCLPPRHARTRPCVLPWSQVHGVAKGLEGRARA